MKPNNFKKVKLSLSDISVSLEGEQNNLESIALVLMNKLVEERIRLAATYPLDIDEDDDEHGTKPNTKDHIDIMYL